LAFMAGFFLSGVIAQVWMNRLAWIEREGFD